MLPRKAGGERRSPWLLGLIFFVSGVPALLYQIVWQRALFSIYGIDIQSVTAVVSAFMLGLGLGSLLGGRASRLPGLPLLLVFGATEALIGAFGFVSLPIIRTVGDLTLGASPLETGAFTFVLVVLPTVLMGATLPLLTTYLVRTSGNVGSSLGILYFVNTLGAAAACLLAAAVTMRFLGMQGTITLAACLNLGIGVAALVAHAALGHAGSPGTGEAPAAEGGAETQVPGAGRPPLSLALGLLLSACTGFISLSYEILWMRIYAYTSKGYATGFAVLLGAFLAGIALGSLVGRRLAGSLDPSNSRSALGTIGAVILIVNLLAFFVVPVTARAVVSVPPGIMLLFVFVASLGFGTLFPLIAHASVPADLKVGQSVSYLYVANIVGSTLGSLITGFVMLDRFTFATTATALAAGGAVVAAVTLVFGAAAAKRGLLGAACGAVALGLLALGPLAHDDMYGRLLFKNKYASSPRVTEVIETKSGVSTVTEDGRLYGGGVYDGRFKIDLVDDTNMLIRPASISLFHAAPKRMLVVGLGTGTWAQLVAQHPHAEHTTIIELSDGQLGLIRRTPLAASLLQSPKVSVVTDDARRWLRGHPEERFDVVIMNTTYHWRASATNLLSAEFLELIRRHLLPGGVALYNATYSTDSYKTGATVFPHAARVLNSMWVSDSPLVPHKERWRQVLLDYRIDGAPLFDLGKPEHGAALARTLGLADTIRTPSTELLALESRESLLSRLGGSHVITDDNMATEWQELR